jgi:toxin FitB
MIILDTNVITAMMRLDSEPQVRAWINRQRVEDFYLPTPTMFEVSYGIAKLDPGKRQRELELLYAEALRDFIGDRLLPFDPGSAEAAGLIFSSKALRGRVELVVDIQIAGIAKALNASVATRNVKDFAGMGLNIINPWDAP